VLIADTHCRALFSACPKCTFNVARNVKISHFVQINSEPLADMPKQDGLQTKQTKTQSHDVTELPKTLAEIGRSKKYVFSVSRSKHS